MLLRNSRAIQAATVKKKVPIVDYNIVTLKVRNQIRVIPHASPLWATVARVRVT